jgi:hypothetical protein
MNCATFPVCFIRRTALFALPAAGYGPLIHRFVKYDKWQVIRTTDLLTLWGLIRLFPDFAKSFFQKTNK